MGVKMIELKARSITKIDSNGFFSSIDDYLAPMIIIFVGGTIGVIAFVLFVPLNILLIRRKYKENEKRQSISLLSILGLVVLITLIHYLIEFELNWI